MSYLFVSSFHWQSSKQFSAVFKHKLQFFVHIEAVICTRCDEKTIQICRKLALNLNFYKCRKLALNLNLLDEECYLIALLAGSSTETQTGFSRH